ncbi:MAG: hypothetical protein RLZ98_2672 [Pseudomonadota bacterium]|jgi:catechol 2,3-dioxygenase-like lactoylglutathione lyase family enzyme
MGAAVRYVAFLTDDPDSLSRFYSRHFGFDELGRSNEGDVSITDGYMNFTFLKRRDLHFARNECGLHHIGLAVDDIDDVRARYKAIYPNRPIIEQPGGKHFGEFMIFDPEANPISISTSNFGLGKAEDRMPRLRHIALNALWPEDQLNFHILMFGFRELTASLERRREGKHNRFCGDGEVNLAVHPFFNKSDGHEAHYGVNHIGFLVSDVGDSVGRLSQEVDAAKRPATRPYAEYRLVDPEGNKFDLSQTKGWEIDWEKWSKAA